MNVDPNLLLNLEYTLNGEDLTICKDLETIEAALQEGMQMVGVLPWRDMDFSKEKHHGQLFIVVRGMTPQTIVFNTLPRPRELLMGKVQTGQGPPYMVLPNGQIALRKSDFELLLLLGGYVLLNAAFTAQDLLDSEFESVQKFEVLDF